MSYKLNTLNPHETRLAMNESLSDCFLYWCQTLRAHFIEFSVSSRFESAAKKYLFSLIEMRLAQCRRRKAAVASDSQCNSPSVFVYEARVSWH